MPLGDAEREAGAPAKRANTALRPLAMAAFGTSGDGRRFSPDCASSRARSTGMWLRVGLPLA